MEVISILHFNKNKIELYGCRISKMVSYWRNNRDRIFGQMTLWNKNSEAQELEKLSPTEDQGAILGQVKKIICIRFLNRI